MAYASLVCLTNILDENIQLNLIPQISQYVQTLFQEARFFQDFLEKSSNKSTETAKYLESRIRDAAYKAQDIVESHVADRLKKSGTRDEVCFRSVWRILRSICSSIPQSNQSFTSLFQELDEVMEEINSIKQEVMHIWENSDEPQVQSSISLPACSSRPPLHGMTTMVGLDDLLKEIKTRLVSGSSQREIVALVGMGGIGKTTLAQKVYNEKSILSHFDSCGWATVSQEHNVRNILLGLLDSMGKLTGELRIADKEKLAEVLYKSLKHMRYLIVLDDMWDTQVWDDLKRILADDENGSRILLTTRLKKVAEYENNCPPHHVRFLSDEESWSLFCRKVFEHECCPPELEKVGKEIVRNCRGLPLEVNVIGGHLSKATRTPQYWTSVEKNLSEIIISEGDDQCSRILSLSYENLPHHLRGCFLYMSIFPEDYEIKVFPLIHLWIASGLVKQESSKSFDDVANEYFLNLVERNLITVSGRRYNGKIVRCKIHDLIRDLCVKEAESEKFFGIIDKTLYHDGLLNVYGCVDVSPHSLPLRALYLKHCDLPTLDTNIRFLYREGGGWKTVSLTHKFLHLHTIHVDSYPLKLNIWEMPQLRHVISTYGVTVPDPPATNIGGGNSVTVLGKLQTLQYVSNLTFTGEVLRRIQNIKKLAVEYATTNLRDLGLNNLESLHKLESLQCIFNGESPLVSIHDMSFPASMKKLTLCGSKLPWKDMTVVGSLPNLQMLKLKESAFRGEEWEPNEGEFLNLKTLFLGSLDLVYWRAEADHFTELQHLFIQSCEKLQEIPLGFGEIPTLQLIKIKTCRISVETSAREIEEEQHNFGNEGLQVIAEGCF